MTVTSTQNTARTLYLRQNTRINLSSPQSYGQVLGTVKKRLASLPQRGGDPDRAYMTSIWGQRLVQVEGGGLAKLINSAQRTVLLILTGAYCMSPLNALQVLGGVMPLNFEIHKCSKLYARC